MRRSREKTLFIPFRAVTVIRSRSARPKFSLERVKKSTKRPFSFQEKEYSALSEHGAKQTTRFRGKIPELLPSIRGTIKEVVWRHGISIAPPPCWIAITCGFVRVYIGISSSERSPQMKTLDRSVKTSGNKQ